MPPSHIACYCRVSTEDQNLDRQLESTHEYAQSELNADLGNVETYRDKSKGTDTARNGYRELMNAVDNCEVNAVIVHEISRLARSLQDLDRTVEHVTDADADIHFVPDNLRFSGEDNPMTRLQMQMLGAFAEWEARVKQMNTRGGSPRGDRKMITITGDRRSDSTRRMATSLKLRTITM